MASRLETGLSVLFTASSVLFASTFAYRTFVRPPSSQNSGRGPRAPEFLADWHRLQTEGIRIGAKSAKVTILEFGDFECPVCRTFHADVRTVLRRYPRDVALVYLHFPLPQHRFAMPSARAAECGDEQGVFPALHDLMFEKQDSLGLKSWASFATEANVPDSAEFLNCLASNREFPRIAAGVAHAKKIDALGTPTILVNGWRIFRTPSAAELTQMVETLRTGRPLGAIAAVPR